MQTQGQSNFCASSDFTVTTIVANRALIESAAWASPIHSDWKLVDSFPGKILSVNEDTVLVEIVTDSGTNSTEERILSISLFAGLSLQVGSYFKLLCFERPNATMIEVSPGINGTEKDFPRFDFDKFSTRSIFE